MDKIYRLYGCKILISVPLMLRQNLTLNTDLLSENIAKLCLTTEHFMLTFC